MVDLECPHRRKPVRMLGWFVAFSASLCLAEPVAVSPRWQVLLPPVANGPPLESTAVPIEGGSLLVTVVAGGADMNNPRLQLGNRAVVGKSVGYDPVSHLQFIQVADGSLGGTAVWLKDTLESPSLSLVAMTPAGPAKCRTTGWIKQVNGKILPLALLRVTFGRGVPPPGTPLMDESGRIAAIIFQDSGSGNVGYAIPAEAVQRVQRDIFSEGHLVRGWLGLSLKAESQAPQIFRVLPDSPALAAGIQPGDVLVSIGSRQVSDYADAANAFFYLVPGVAVKVKLLRGVEQMDFVLTPTRPKS